jgi:hypothetical protein
MQIGPYVHGLQEDLAAAAGLAGSEAAEEAGRRLAQALEPSLQLRLLDLLSEIALGLSAQVPGRIEVRLAGREPELVYVEEEQPEPAAAPGDDALTARIIRALSRGLESRSVRVGRRLTGYADS